jgi:hypothetical protein
MKATRLRTPPAVVDVPLDFIRRCNRAKIDPSKFAVFVLKEIVASEILFEVVAKEFKKV